LAVKFRCCGVLIFLERKDLLEIQKSSFKEPGLQLQAFVPLGFGGKKAQAILRVYVEREKEEFWKKQTPAIYFVFTTQTDKQGELQWSIYLKGRQVAIQVFSDMAHGERDGLQVMVVSVEKKLRDLGFQLMAPTVYLKKPFRTPEGFRLNIKG
jgi:hypothetical protein